MALKKNIIANYASQLYATAAGIVMVPLYIEYMGAEPYGLVGFFSMLQAFFNLLDMGLTPTMARESARFNGGAISALEYRRLARALEGVFVGIALSGGVLLYVLAESIAGDWLNAKQLPQEEIIQALRLMAGIIALRWMCGLYRGVIIGAERLIWLSGFNCLIATGRFVLVLPVLIFISASSQTFFSFQLIVALVEVVGLTLMGYRLLPAIPAGQSIRWEWVPLKPIIKFSLSIAFTSSVWVLTTQTDKLILSKILTLSEYGYFTAAVLVASGITIMSGPISGAIMPHMSRLQAENQQAKLTSIYKEGTKIVSVIVMPIALVLTFFSWEVLWAWTGDVVLADMASPVLSLYAAGYGVLAVAAFPYYLQYAKGDLKLHLIGNLIFVIILIPTIIYSTKKFGMIGAGWSWLFSNVAYFMFWIPLVHRRVMPGIHYRWLISCIFGPLLGGVIAACLVTMLATWSSQRWFLTLELLFSGFIILVFSYLATKLDKFKN